MKTKKVISIVLLAVIAFLTIPSFVAAEDDTEIVVAWWGSQRRIDSFVEALDLYSQEKGIKIETQTNGFGDHLTSLSTAGASGDMPEMFMLQSSYMGQFIDSNLLLDLRPAIEEGKLDLSNVPQNVIDTCVVDDAIYGVCAGVNAPALVYNKTLLDEAGITVPDYQTIDDFCALAKEIHDKTGYKTHLYNNSSFIEYLARAHGSQLCVDGELGVSGPEDLIEYFELIERGKEEGWILDYSVAVAAGGSIEENPLVNGAEPEFASWCTFYYSNQVQALQDAAPEDVELAITTWPSPDVEASNYLRQAMCWCISADSPNRDIAVDLLNWWTNEVEAQSCIKGEPGLPANTEVAEAIKPLLPMPTQKAFTFVNEVVLPCSSPANPPASNGYNEVLTLIDDLCDQVYGASLSAEEAAETLFEEGSDIMATANK